MIHIYNSGYSVLPALKKLETSPFLNNEILIKERRLASEKQKVFFEHDIDQKIYDPICRYISNETNQKISSFDEMALNLAEDVIIHRIKDEKDWMAAGHICLPSGWLPEEKIGKPLEEIHKPVPGMKNNHFKLVETMINKGPFLRYVWSVIFEERYNFHPRIPKKEFNAVSNNLIFIKVEEQMTIGFPQVNAALFVLRQNIIKPQDIDYKGLYMSCSKMNELERKYKGISEDFLIYLKDLSIE
jgi:hypothetical protein